MTWRPNSVTERRWHSTGSPTATDAEEKLGSLSVHCRRVPAGRTISRALAHKVRRETKHSRDTTRSATAELDFIESPRSHAPKIRGTVPKQPALSQPRLREVKHKVCAAVNRPLRIKACLFCNRVTEELT